MQKIQETWAQSLRQEDPVEEGMATQLQYSCLDDPMDRGAQWATVHGVVKRPTRLKCLSTHTQARTYTEQENMRSVLDSLHLTYM